MSDENKTANLKAFRVFLQPLVLIVAHHSRAGLLHVGDIGARVFSCRSHVLRTASGMPLSLAISADSGIDRVAWAMAWGDRRQMLN